MGADRGVVDDHEIAAGGEMRVAEYRRGSGDAPERRAALETAPLDVVGGARLDPRRDEVVDLIAVGDTIIRGRKSVVGQEIVAIHGLHETREVGVGSADDRDMITVGGDVHVEWRHTRWAVAFSLALRAE